MGRLLNAATITICASCGFARLPVRAAPTPRPTRAPFASPLSAPVSSSFRASSSKGPAAMGLNYRAPLVREAQDEHTATVIFLHGLGDTGAGWFDVGQMLSPALPHVKFVFPNAPDRPITLNMGMRMPGWYDIAALDAIDAKEDADGINESVRYVKELVAAEKVPSDRVVVGGFSQGGAIALGMLRTDVPLAGVAGLSTYMPLHTQPGVVAATHKQTPVFQAHGDADQVVAFSFGTNTKALLEKEGVDVTWRVYNGMPHSACPEELQDLAQWLAKTLPPK